MCFITFSIYLESISQIMYHLNQAILPPHPKLQSHYLWKYQFGTTEKHLGFVDQGPCFK